MATYNKINDFVEQSWLGLHDMNTDQVNLYLTNVAPVATNTVFGTPAEIAAGNDYVAKGEDTGNVMSENPAGTAEVVATDITWTASGGAIAQFRYVVAFNETNGSDALIGWYDHGSAVDLADGESFTVDFGANWLTFV